MKSLASTFPSRASLRRFPFGTWALATLLVVSAHQARAQSSPFTSGNLVVERLGDNSSPLGLSGASVFVDQFSPAGAPGQTIDVSNTSTVPFTNAGSGGGEAQLTASPNGLFLAIAGYQAAPGTSNVASTSSNIVPRIAQTINPDGTISFTGETSGAFSGATIRSAVYDDNATTAWAVGTTTGVVLTGAGNVVSSAQPAGNVLGIYAGTGAPGGQLYFSSSASPNQGINAVGTGEPTDSGQPATLVIADTTGKNPFAFSFNTSLTVAYLADASTLAAGGGIQKYTNTSGTWSLAYTFGTGAGLTNGSRSLAVDWTNPNAPVLYSNTIGTAGSGNQIVKITDTGSNATAKVLATAPANEGYRGVQLALMPSSWMNNHSNVSGSVNLVTSSSDTPFSNLSTILADGSNLSFPNVNTGGGGVLSLTVNNNSALQHVSSINFPAGGFGSNPAGTSYTLAGSGTLGLLGGFGLSAIGSFSASRLTLGIVIGNSSGLTQTVALPLSLGNSGAFRAVNGDLQITGPVTTSSGNTLTIGGTANTTFGINAPILGAGGLNKVESGTATLNAGVNSYTGPTQLFVGILKVNGSLAQTSSISVSGSLQLGASNVLNDAANLTLAGGTLSTGGFSEFTGSGTGVGSNGQGAGLGTLSFSLGSTIDFAHGSSSILWLSGVGTTSGTLSIANWTGSLSGGGNDQLRFTSDPAALLGEISFTGFTGAREVFFPNTGGTAYFEVLPIPEPSSAILIVLGTGLAASGCRRRRR